MTGYDDELDRILGTAMSGILAKLEAALDHDAGLADVYARSARGRPDAAGPGRGSAGSSRLEEACDQIDQLTAWLEDLIQSGQENPLGGSSFLELARDNLVQLRAGLAARNMARPEARQLTADIGDQLAQADQILRSQHAATLDDAASSRTGRAGSLTGQAQAVRELVARLYEPDRHDLSLTPSH
jgi:hypothetical protein